MVGLKLIPSEWEECVFGPEPCFCWELAVCSFVFWFILLHVLKFCTHAFMMRFFTQVDSGKAFLPKEFPVPVKDGVQEEWTVPMTTASEKELDRFLTFRQVGTTYLTLKEKQQRAAIEATKYRGQVLDQVLLRYFDLKVSKKQELPHPVDMKPWNGWNAFYLELGPEKQKMWCGSAAWTIEHAVAGLLAVYARYYDLKFARSFLYCDIGFNAVDLILFIVSLVIKYDVSTFSGWRRMDVSKGDASFKGIFIPLTLHHFGGLLLEALSLAFDYNPVLWTEIGIAMLGTTGFLHFVSALTDATPIRETPMFFGISAVTLLAMFWYRGVKWVYYCFVVVSSAYDRSGMKAAFAFGSGLFLFTLFNIQFFNFYLKKTERAFKELKASSAPSKKKFQ